MCGSCKSGHIIYNSQLYGRYVVIKYSNRTTSLLCDTFLMIWAERFYGVPT